MKTRLLISLTLVFFLGMAVLTFAARDIHNASLPQVTAKRLTRESFDGGFTRRLAVPKELLTDGSVFIVTTRMINGETRNVAVRVSLQTGKEADGFCEVTDGMRGHELVIFKSDRGLRDGDEVLVAAG